MHCAAGRQALGGGKQICVCRAGTAVISGAVTAPLPTKCWVTGVCRKDNRKNANEKVKDNKPPLTE